MKTILILALLAACYDKTDARKDIGQNGGPDPINCVRGDGCVNFGHVAHTAPGGAR